MIGMKHVLACSLRQLFNLALVKARAPWIEFHRCDDSENTLLSAVEVSRDKDLGAPCEGGLQNSSPSSQCFVESSRLRARPLRVINATHHWEKMADCHAIRQQTWAGWRWTGNDAIAGTAERQAFKQTRTGDSQKARYRPNLKPAQMPLPLRSTPPQRLPEASARLY